MIELLAYKKAYLHALKFVKDDVIGVLTGRVEGNQIIVEDAYPLFHTRVLAATLESAFQLVNYNFIKKKKVDGSAEKMIEGALKKKPNQVIVGVYEGLSHSASSGRFLSEISTRILERIEKNLKAKPVALRLFDEEISQQSEKEQGDEEVESQRYLASEILVFELKDSKQIEINYTRVAAEAGAALKIFEQVSGDIKNNKHRLIIDFDCHFEDISLDFTNSFV